jgi:hypothetical protein
VRLLKDNKGQIRIIEAFFASILLLSSLTLIPMVQEHSSDSTEILSSTAHNLLLSLDSDGQLASLIGNESWVNLKSCVQSSLSPMMWFNLIVFDENMTRVNDIPITSGNAVNDRIVAVDYVCASTSSNYAVYVIRLQLAEVD